MHRCHMCNKKVDVIDGVLARHGSMIKMCIASGSKPFTPRVIHANGKSEPVKSMLPGMKRTPILA